MLLGLLRRGSHGTQSRPLPLGQRGRQAFIPGSPSSSDPPWPCRGRRRAQGGSELWAGRQTRAQGCRDAAQQRLLRTARCALLSGTGEDTRRGPGPQAAPSRRLWSRFPSRTERPARTRERGTPLPNLPSSPGRVPSRAGDAAASQKHSREDAQGGGFTLPAPARTTARNLFEQTPREDSGLADPAAVRLRRLLPIHHLSLGLLPLRSSTGPALPGPVRVEIRSSARAGEAAAPAVCHPLPSSLVAPGRGTAPRLREQRHLRPRSCSLRHRQRGFSSTTA